jgi:hypothetical protein
VLPSSPAIGQSTWGLAGTLSGGSLINTTNGDPWTPINHDWDKFMWHFSDTVSHSAATAGNVAPAAAPVPASSSVGYFSSESTQLTAAVLANLTALNLTGIEYFDFGSAPSAASTRDVAGCRLLPGDASWPADVIWNVFDFLLGGALIVAVPVAAPCYASQPQYNADECATITSEWSSPEFQYVNTISHE